MIHHFTAVFALQQCSDFTLRAAFPPSLHDIKAIYRVCTPTAPRFPRVHAPVPGQGPPQASLFERCNNKHKYFTKDNVQFCSQR